MKKFTIYLVFQFFAFGLLAQYSVHGKITDDEGNALSGVNISVTNVLLGTVSDQNGKFEISNLAKRSYEMNFSFIGYKTKQVKVEMNGNVELNVLLEETEYLTDEFVVKAIQAGDKRPLTYSSLKKKEIQEKNFGQDIPYILLNTPALVVTSDAGTGIGYTNFRIRGTDLNRINVTLNGIPMNDAESHGVWWVDLPDFAESVDNIQIQRGVGTSTNGAASFGASVNLQTTTLKSLPYTKFSLNGGAFNTLKSNLNLGTGLINNHFTFDARLSKISSDGYIDRAWVNLKSFYISGGYYSKKSILKLNIFSGFEESYQAWNGVPSVRLNNDVQGMQNYLDHGLYSQQQYDDMIHSDSRTYNIYTYENEIDHYQQDYFQLIFTHEFNKNINANFALHSTLGKGYYEQFKVNESLVDYGLQPVYLTTDTIDNTDIIRRKWLDNDFNGLIYSLSYRKNRLQSDLGGSVNQYIGNHYGRIIWAQYASNGSINHEWYRSKGDKFEYSVYEKVNYQLTERMNVFADLQLRNINYKISGIDDDLRDIGQNHKYGFFNPKAGLNYSISSNQNAYVYIGIANREPSRSNLVDADPSKPLPVAENLTDYEAGYNFTLNRIKLLANLYFMDYKDQLVLTGEINDVGAAIMTNVDKSYRAGVEISLNTKLLNSLEWNTNINLSRNKINEFIEYVDNWDYWGDVSLPYQYTFSHKNTDLSFSPNITINNSVSYLVNENLVISLSTNFVGSQFIDNTSDEDNRLNSYLVNNLALHYNLKLKNLPQIKFNLRINNLFNTEYETNAWLYKYVYNQQTYKMDGFFPQAGIHLLGGFTLEF